MRVSGGDLWALVLRSTDRAGRRDLPLSIVHIPLGCGLDFGVKIRCSLHLWTGIVLPFAVLPECRFYIPKVIAFTITPRNLTAASLRSYHRKVISHSDGHSVVTDFWATKKAGTSKWYVPTLKGQNSPVKGKLVITFRCNRLWDSKSRPLFACSSANDAEMLRGKRRYFRLVYRRPYPTFSRRFFNNFVILRNIFSCSPSMRVFQYTR